MAAKKRPVFRTDDCVSCRMCVQSCSVSCLTLTKTGKSGKYVNLFPEITGTCIGCGLCAAACPMDCITMEEVPVEG